MRLPDKMISFTALAALAVVLTACGGGGGGGTSGKDASSDLILIDVSVGSQAGVPLNEILVFEFSEALDPDTVRADTIQIRRGPNFGFQVPGDFRVDGDRVEFFPRLPVLPDLSDAGFQPGTTYRVTLPGTPKAATVRSFANDRLRRKQVAIFETSVIASQMFVDNFLDPLPPRVLFVNPADGAVNVPTESEIQLTFNRRGLDPATISETNIHLELVERDGVTLELPVQGEPLLAQSHDSVRVTFRSRFPLADRATYRLTVERRAQDLVGNDVVPFKSTFTTRDEAPRPGAVVLEFNAQDKASLMDEEITTASWDDAKPGELAALFTVAGGDGTAGDLNPSSNQNFTPDDFAKGVLVQNIAGQDMDVFNFRSINIPAGVTVRFSAPASGTSRPVVLLSLKEIRITGTLTVAGGRGENGETNTRNSSIPKTSGGAGGPGGSSGADNYTGSKATTAPAQHGEDVLFGGGGGKGGNVAKHSNYNYAGGGGGGGSREAGKVGTKGGHTTASWNGSPGAGGATAAARGFPVNLERRPNVGGAGGGAGGLGYYWPSSTNWRQGAGSGGGGGGGITIQGAGDVIIGAQGVVSAAGGAGGGTSVGNSYYGGAGGGGAGGSILLRAASRVIFNAGAELDVAGGAGGKYINTFAGRKGGEGGLGGDGYIRIEAREDENSPGKPLIQDLNKSNLTYNPVSQGLFSPVGGGAPSIGQTRWINLGVFDPEMVKPSASDTVATLFNDSMTIEVQMAIEDRTDLGNPDLSALDITDLDGDGDNTDTLDASSLSEWTPFSSIESLNGLGYQFLRIRVTFQLDSSQTPTDPLPGLDRLRAPYRF